jgi:hypothetical protein
MTICGPVESFTSIGMLWSILYLGKHFLVPQVETLRRDLSAPPHSLQFDERKPAIPDVYRKSALGSFVLRLLMFDDRKNQLIIGGP